MKLRLGPGLDVLLFSRRETLRPAHINQRSPGVVLVLDWETAMRAGEQSACHHFPLFRGKLHAGSSFGATKPKLDS